VVRKVLFMAAVAAAAAFALSASSVASAWDCTTGCSTSGPVVYVEQYADLAFGGFVMVVLDVRCRSVDGLGEVDFEVFQQGSQSSAGTDGFGSGTSTVNCDGNWHRLDVSTIGAAPFNLGCALVTNGVLLVTDTSTSTSTRKKVAEFQGTIQIVD
jgi:hypothetical protein